MRRLFDAPLDDSIVQCLNTALGSVHLFSLSSAKSGDKTVCGRWACGVHQGSLPRGRTLHLALTSGRLPTVPMRSVKGATVTVTPLATALSSSRPGPLQERHQGQVHRLLRRLSRPGIEIPTTFAFFWFFFWLLAPIFSPG